jgi:hypothetical protein
MESCCLYELQKKVIFLLLLFWPSSPTKNYDEKRNVITVELLSWKFPE